MKDMYASMTVRPLNQFRNHYGLTKDISPRHARHVNSPGLNSLIPNNQNH